MANNFNLWTGGSTTNFNSSSQLSVKSDQGFNSGDRLLSQQFNGILREITLTTTSLLDAVLLGMQSVPDISINPNATGGGISRTAIRDLISSRLLPVNGISGTGYKTTYSNGVATSTEGISASDIPSGIDQSKIANLEDQLGKVKIGDTWYTVTYDSTTATLSFDS